MGLSDDLKGMSELDKLIKSVWQPLSFTFQRLKGIRVEPRSRTYDTGFVPS